MSNHRFFALTRTACTSVAMAAVMFAALPLAQAAGVPGQGTWQGTLKGRDLDGNSANGFEAYYDTDLNISWLADANYALTSGYNVKNVGLFDWTGANAWASQLNVGGVTGWRLPTMLDTGTPGCNRGYSGTDCGYNVDTNTSELAHMFYVTLGNKAPYNAAGVSQSGYGLTNPGNFVHLGSAYWTGVEYASNPINAWYFNGNGLQDYAAKAPTGAGFYAWAVHAGDVGAVPEPSAHAMAVIGFAALLVVGGLRRKL